MRTSLLHAFCAALAIAPALATAAPFAYVTHQAANNVEVIDLATQASVATIPVGSQPFGVAVNPGGAFAYVGNTASNSVSVIAIASNTVATTIPGIPGPVGIAINAAGTRVYAGGTGSTDLTVIDTATQAVAATVPLGSVSFGVTVNPAGTRVYAALAAVDSVAVINTASNTVVATVPVGAFPVSIVVNPDGTRAYVANSFGLTVSVIDTATNAVVDTIALPAASQLIGTAFDPSGTRLFVTDLAPLGEVYAINPATGTVIATIPVGSGPAGISVNPAGTQAYVANFIDDSISVIDVATLAVTATLPSLGGPVAFGRFIGGIAPAPVGAVQAVPAASEWVLLLIAMGMLLAVARRYRATV